MPIDMVVASFSLDHYAEIGSLRSQLLAIFSRQDRHKNLWKHYILDRNIEPDINPIQQFQSHIKT